MPPASNQVFPVSVGAARLNCTVGWYKSKLSARVFPGRKIANKWAVTEADIQEALEICLSPAIHKPVPDPVSARPRTRLRYERERRNRYK